MSIVAYGYGIDTLGATSVAQIIGEVEIVENIEVEIVNPIEVALVEAIEVTLVEPLEVEIP